MVKREEDDEDEGQNDAVLNEGGETTSEVRKKVQSLVKSVDTSYVEMSRLLFRVHAGTYWSDWGFESFEEYVQNELGFEERKAKYLVAIWKRLRVDLNVPRKKLERIGWTRAKTILGVVDENNIDEWLEKAYRMKVAELEKAVKKKKGKKGADEDFVNLNFKLSTEQYENVEEAIEQGKIEADSDKRGHVLDLICTEWKANRLKPTEKLLWIMKQIERVFGCRLLAIRNEALFKKLAALVKAEKAGAKPAEAKPKAKVEEKPAKAKKAKPAEEEKKPVLKKKKKAPKVEEPEEPEESEEPEEEETEEPEEEETEEAEELEAAEV